MNLLTYININAGGPGSGRHEEGSSKPVHTSTHLTALKHGFSFDGNKNGTSHYSLGHNKIEVQKNGNWHHTKFGDTIELGKGYKFLNDHLSK